jgi:hypothetical protein
VKLTLSVLAVLALACGSAAAQTGATAGTSYDAPDGSLSLRVPQGWRATASTIGTLPVQVLQPDGGGEERMIVGTGPATTNSIQELALQTLQLVTQQLLPGARVASQPKFVRTASAPVAELSYRGPDGQSFWWQAVMLKDSQYITVLAGARPDRAAMIEQQSREVFGSIRVRQGQKTGAPAGQPNGRLANLIVGHWTWYHRTENASGSTAASTNKEIWIYPNGRYQYTAVTYVPNMPSGIDPTTTITGSYEVQGNRLVARADNGQQAMFTVEIVDGGKGMKLDGELYIRE